MIVSKDEFKSAVLALVNERRNVSFAEIAQLPGAEGPYALELSTSNVWFWSGLSEAAVHAMIELRADGDVHYNPTDILSYFIDGVTLDLPLVRSIPREGYREPHWMPVLIEPGPDPVYGKPHDDR